MAPLATTQATNGRRLLNATTTHSRQLRKLFLRGLRARAHLSFRYLDQRPVLRRRFVASVIASLALRKVINQPARPFCHAPSEA